MLTLIADELPRFMVCNDSINMPQHVPFNVDDTIRDEGNAAHWLIEQLHKGKHTGDELVDRKASNGVYITAEMVEDTALFLKDTMGKGAVEINTSYGDGQRYQVNGRADQLDYEPMIENLNIRDFKYGWGIVEPENNWTLISHALGWIFANPTMPVKTITLHIYQPRPHHPLGKHRTYTYTHQGLMLKWCELEATLTNPDNYLNTSEHCRKCKALATCPAAQKAGMNALDVSETSYVSDLDNEALAFMLDQIKRALKVLEGNEKAYTELALHRLKAGQIIPNYMAEKDLTNSQWKKGITVEVAQLLTGKDLAKKQLITPSQAIKQGVSEEVVKSLCERHEKGVKLARMTAETMVKKMFKGM